MQTRATIGPIVAEGGAAEREGLPRACGPRPAGAVAKRRRPPSIRATHLLNSYGGEGGIRTLEHLLGCYSLSRRAPSTTRPPLHSNLKPNQSGPQGYRRRPGRSNRGRCTEARALRGRTAGDPLNCSPPPCWAAQVYSGAAHQDRRRAGPAAAAQAPPWEWPVHPAYSAYPAPAGPSAAPLARRADIPAAGGTRPSYG